MAASLVMRIEVTDETRWRAYRDAVMPVIAAFGGTHVTGPAAAEQLEAPNGPKRLAVFAFPSAAAIRAFWSSPEYAPVMAMRYGAARLEAWVVDGS